MVLSIFVACSCCRIGKLIQQCYSGVASTDETKAARYKPDNQGGGDAHSSARAKVKRSKPGEKHYYSGTKQVKRKQASEAQKIEQQKQKHRKSTTKRASKGNRRKPKKEPQAKDYEEEGDNEDVEAGYNGLFAQVDIFNGNTSSLSNSNDQRNNDDGADGAAESPGTPSSQQSLLNTMSSPSVRAKRGLDGSFATTSLSQETHEPDERYESAKEDA